jgi:hypothetical protein
LISKRIKQLTQKVVIVDGLIGGGKGMLAPIVSSLPNVEMWLHRPLWEVISQMYYIGEISEEAAALYFQFASDDDIYNLQIGRELNVRPSDLTGIFKSRNFVKYIKRILDPRDGDVLVDKILGQKPVLCVMTHALCPTSKPLFNAFNDRLVFLRIVRSPANDYMLRLLMRWTERWKNHDVRSSFVTLHSENSLDGVPYIIKGHEREYLEVKTIEKAILLLREWQTIGDETMESMRINNAAKIIEIPFEKFVISPYDYIDDVAKSLNTAINSKTVNAMKKEKVPRDGITDAGGRHNQYYAAQGWEPPSFPKEVTINSEVKKGFDFAVSEGASEKYISILRDLQSRYAERHLG